jgi:hypothetical protein
MDCLCAISFARQTKSDEQSNSAHRSLREICPQNLTQSLITRVLSAFSDMPRFTLSCQRVTASGVGVGKRGQCATRTR